MRGIATKQRLALDETDRAWRSAEERFDAISEELKQWQAIRTEQCAATAITPPLNNH